MEGVKIKLGNPASIPLGSLETESSHPRGEEAVGLSTTPSIILERGEEEVC